MQYDTGLHKHKSITVFIENPENYLYINKGRWW